MTYKFPLQCCFLFVIIFIASSVLAQELYELPTTKKQTRWVSFENKTGEKGQGGIENKGAKGHAFDLIAAGETMTILDYEGSGSIRRMWFTFSDRRPEMLRSLVINMYWEGTEKPAVSAPIGDFFGVGLGKRHPFESALFSDPEGRSFNCFIPMPFQQHAKITIVNESENDLIQFFYDIDLLEEQHDDQMLYFHTYWSRELETELANDFTILPAINGKGKFLGINVGVFGNPDYEDLWFGEGEIKMYVDGDNEYPTIVGTGTEDYVGTAYGQGTFDHQFQGSLIADPKKGHYAFYRYHIPDPVYFYEGIQVDLQQMGGGPQERVRELVRNGAKLIPVTVHNGENFYNLLEQQEPLDLFDENLPKGWTNFYRSDDVSATAYFYLNKPVSSLPKLANKQVRITNLDHDNEVETN